MESFYLAFNEFSRVYSCLDRLLEILDRKPEVEKALIEFNGIDKNDELSLSNWLKKYDHLEFDTFSEVIDQYFEEGTFENYFKLFQFKISTKEFLDIIEFRRPYFNRDGPFLGY
jgi:hypothetical protein